MMIPIPRHDSGVMLALCCVRMPSRVTMAAFFIQNSEKTARGGAILAAVGHENTLISSRFEENPRRGGSKEHGE